MQTHRTLFGSTLATVLCIAIALPPQALAQPKPAAPPKPAPAAPAAEPAPAAPKPLSETLTGDAKAEYDAAKLLYVDGDFAGALIKFARAHELSKDARLLWNMAAVEKNLRHYARVLELLERYLKEGGDLLTPQDRVDATDLAGTVKGFVATVTVTVDQPGAAVSIDDAAMGTSPLPSPVKVDMGARKVRVTKEGFKEFAETRQLSGATDVVVDVKLEKVVHEGRLVVVAKPDQAIQLDGKPIGVGNYDGIVASGGHSLRVTAKGFKPYQAEITIKDGETRNIQVTLDEESSSTTTWLLVGGGAVLAAGAVVGIIFGLRAANEEKPATAASPTPGTIPPGTIQLPSWRWR